jgi:hypothetical protein
MARPPQASHMRRWLAGDRGLLAGLNSVCEAAGAEDEAIEAYDVSAARRFPAAARSPPGSSSQWYG